MKDNLRGNSVSPDLAYRRGDIIVVVDDAHEWGSAETLPNFLVVKIPSASLSKVKSWMDEHRQDVIGPGIDIGEYEVVGRRKWQFQVDSLPIGLQNKITDNNGTITIGTGQDASWNSTRAFFFNKVDLVSEIRNEVDLA